MPAENEILQSWGSLCLPKMRSSMMQWAVTSNFSGMVLLHVHAHQAKQGMAGAGAGQGKGQGRAGTKQGQGRGREGAGTAAVALRGKAQYEAPEDKPDLCRPG